MYYIYILYSQCTLDIGKLTDIVVIQPVFYLHFITVFCNTISIILYMKEKNEVWNHFTSFQFVSLLCTYIKYSFIFKVSQ